MARTPLTLQKKRRRAVSLSLGAEPQAYFRQMPLENHHPSKETTTTTRERSELSKDHCCLSCLTFLNSRAIAIFSKGDIPRLLLIIRLTLVLSVHATKVDESTKINLCLTFLEKRSIHSSRDVELTSGVPPHRVVNKNACEIFFVFLRKISRLSHVSRHNYLPS